MKKIVIIGGGIAGLASAYRIQEEISNGASLECTVLEGSDKFGGKISTDRRNGFIVERGPDSFISQKPWAIELCKKLGLGDSLVGTNPDFSSTYVYTGKKMVTMPDGLSLMIPTKFLPFALTPLFSWPGKIRMAMDLIIPKKSDDSDESLHSFVMRRLGDEALKKMAEPMLAGIYASDPKKMSIKSTFPMFVQTEQKYRSLILGMLARKRQMGGNNNSQKGKPRPFSLFVTLKNGLGEMVDTLIEKSPAVEFCSGTRAQSVAPNGAGWNVELEGGESLAADAVILATPANLSARLIESPAPEVARLLNRINYVSTATVSIAYKKEGFPHPLNGFGFVIPRVENRKILACTWTSSKFPQRVPENFVMLRCFVGGATREELAKQDEDAIAAMVKQELFDIMGIDKEPVFCRVFHNRKANVQYHVGHANLIQSIGEALKTCPGLFLAGSAYTGIGIPDCVLNGTKTSESVLNYINKKSN